MKVTYKGAEYVTNVVQYGNKNTAIQLVDPQNEDLKTVITVNVETTYPQNWVIIMNGVNTGIVDALLEAGVIENFIEDIQTGDVMSPMYSLTDSFYTEVKQKLLLEEYDVVNEDKLRIILKSMTGLQNDGEAKGLPCPRCGHDKMDDEMMMNALSRYEDIHICSDCGTSEAMLELSGSPKLPLSQWSISSILR